MSILQHVKSQKPKKKALVRGVALSLVRKSSPKISTESHVEPRHSQCAHRPCNDNSYGN